MQKPGLDESVKIDTEDNFDGLNNALEYE